MLYSLLGSCDLIDAVHSTTQNESTLIFFLIWLKSYYAYFRFFTAFLLVYIQCVCACGMKTNCVHKSHHMMW